MSHEISIVNGVAEMAYISTMGTPWHTLGHPINPDAPIEKWQEKACPFSVQRSAVRYAIDRAGTMRTWEDQHVLMRSDNKAPLGLVSDSYKVVQPNDAFEFFRSLTAEFGFKIKTAGTLKGGRIVWVMAEINGEITIRPGQKMRGNVIVSTSFDGSRKTEAANISTDVVCMNTLRMSDAEAGAARVRTSHRSVWRPEAVKETLGISRQSFARFIENVRLLSARKTSTSDAQQFVFNLLRKPADTQVSEVLDTRAAKAILAKYMGAGKGADLEGRADTAWGLVSAVTEYVDHDRPARSNDNRLTSAWFGPGGNLKDKALAQGLAMV